VSGFGLLVKVTFGFILLYVLGVGWFCFLYVVLVGLKNFVRSVGVLVLGIVFGVFRCCL